MSYKLRIACLIGTAFEYFEFQLFGMLMPILVLHFFNPNNHSTNAFFQGYLAFGIAFFARPLGGLLLGYLGDHYGRRRSLLTAMWLMAIGTIAIGLLPGFNKIGVLAMFLLLSFRIVQGLSLGGEFSTGGVFLFEHHSAPKCRDLIWQDLGGSIGLLCATAIIIVTEELFTQAQMQAYAWRFPFFAAFGLSLCGIYIRTSLTNPKTHLSLLAENKNRSTTAYFQQALKQWRYLLLLTFACAPNGIFWYLQVIFIPNQILAIPTSMMLLLISLSLCMIPVGARLADSMGTYRVWIVSVLALVSNFCFFILSTHHAIQIIGVTLQAIFLSINQGPRLYLLNSHFALSIRNLCCSMVYSMANILGGMTPFVAFWLLKQSQHPQTFSQLIFIFGMLAITAMLILKRKGEGLDKHVMSAQGLKHECRISL